jgi:hypothetical protein
MPEGPAFFQVPSHIITVEWGGTPGAKIIEEFSDAIVMELP